MPQFVKLTRKDSQVCFFSILMKLDGFVERIKISDTYFFIGNQTCLKNESLFRISLRKSAKFSFLGYNF